MGLGGISIWQLLIVLLIVVMIFGTKRLRTIGTDLGGALKGFRKAINEADEELQPPRLDDESLRSDAAADRVRERADS